MIAAALGLDPDGQVARAFASRDTWSGITVAFPVDGTDARLTVELSGLPVFDRDRNFPRLSRLRHLPRCRAHRRIDADARAPPGTPARRTAGVPRGAPGACRRATAGECRAVPSRPATLGGRASARTPVERACAIWQTAQPDAPLPPSRELRNPPRAPCPPKATADCRADAETTRDIGPRASAADQRSDPRPAADRRAGLSARQADLRQPRLPRLDRLRRSCTRWRRPAASTRCSSSRATDDLGAEQRRAIADHRHQPRRPGSGGGAAVHLAVGRRIRAGADADRRRQRRRATTGRRPSRRRCASAKAEAGEVRDVLDAAADGVVVLDRDAQRAIDQPRRREAVRLCRAGS